MRKTTPYGIRAIAEKLGISSSTVSRSLNNNPRISRETRAKVLRLARELGRPPEQPVRRGILLILPETRFRMRSYSNEIIDAMREECRREGHFLEMVSSDHLEILNDRDFAGAVSIDFSLQLSRSWAEQHTVPLISLNDYPNHFENIYTVFSDPDSAFRQAVRHLIRNGHRRIGMLQFEGGGSRNLNAEERKKSFFRVMDSFGIGGEAFYGCMDEADKEFPEFHAILKNGISALIVCGEGTAVFRTMNFVKSFHLRIPEDLSLITWETGEFSALATPPLTTVAQNYPELARHALSLLVSGTGKDIAVPCLFHDRESVKKR
ncbi:MAG: LacI family DNA-binding transcriptional regulator [Lentisphaeria bacterium]|nr:LacI family DNA-binding transcriptional regulator [Lentisphaeria bacterium]